MSESLNGLESIDDKVLTRTRLVWDPKNDPSETVIASENLFNLYPIPTYSSFSPPSKIIHASSLKMYALVKGTTTSSNLLTSTDAITWEERTFASAQVWISIAWGNSVFVAVGGATTVANTSTDGITWSNRTMASSLNWSSVAFGNGIFVALSSSTTTLSNWSTDGITWVVSTMGVSQVTSQIYFANNLFFALPSTASVQTYFTSTDGTTWITRTLSSGGLNEVVFGKGIYVGNCTSNGTADCVRYSTDGINWISASTDNITFGGWRGLTFNGDFFFTNHSGNPGRAIISTDGITWTSKPLYIPSSEHLSYYGSISVGNKIISLVNAIPTITETPLLRNMTCHINFSARELVELNRTNSYQPNSSIYTNKKMKLVKEYYQWKDIIQYPYTEWGTYYDNIPSNFQGRRIVWGNSTFCIFSNVSSSNCITSTDAITWTLRTMASAGEYRGATFGAGIFVAVSFTSGTNCNTSTDGITWTQRTMASTGTWQSVMYANGIFVALSNTSGTNCNTSTDGITWTQRTMASTGTWGNVAYGAGLFVAHLTSNSTTLNSSTDGITWVVRTAADAFSWANIEFNGSRFVLVTETSVTTLNTSTDGITWETKNVIGDGNSSKRAILYNDYVTILPNASTNIGESASYSIDGGNNFYSIAVSGTFDAKVPFDANLESVRGGIYADNKFVLVSSPRTGTQILIIEIPKRGKVRILYE